jgi:hypothetical protein
MAAHVARHRVAVVPTWPRIWATAIVLVIAAGATAGMGWLFIAGGHWLAALWFVLGLLATVRLMMALAGQVEAALLAREVRARRP